MKFHPLLSPRNIRIPLIGFKVPAGFPSPAADYIEDRIDLSRQLAPHPLSTFYCRCEGDSMIDACIPPNALLIVDRSLTAKSGDIVVAYISGGFTVKYIRFHEGRCFLVPANKKYLTTEVKEDMEMVVWGVVTSVVIDTKLVRLCTL